MDDEGRGWRVRWHDWRARTAGSEPTADRHRRAAARLVLRSWSASPPPARRLDGGDGTGEGAQTGAAPPAGGSDAAGGTEGAREA